MCGGSWWLGEAHHSVSPLGILRFLRVHKTAQVELFMTFFFFSSVTALWVESRGRDLNSPQSLSDPPLVPSTASLSRPNMDTTGSKNPKRLQPKCQTTGFKMGVKKPLGDVTVAKSIISPVYGSAAPSVPTACAALRERGALNNGIWHDWQVSVPMGVIIGTTCDRSDRYIGRNLILRRILLHRL